MTTANRTASPGQVLRRTLGAAIVLLGLAVLGRQLWVRMATDPVVLEALIGGMMAAGATALGAVPVLFSQRLSDRVQDSLFGFGAGVMLAASAFSLVVPA